MKENCKDTYLAIPYELTSDNSKFPDGSPSTPESAVLSLGDCKDCWCCGFCWCCGKGELEVRRTRQNAKLRTRNENICRAVTYMVKDPLFHTVKGKYYKSKMKSYNTNLILKMSTKILLFYLFILKLTNSLKKKN